VHKFNLFNVTTDLKKDDATSRIKSVIKSFCEIRGFSYREISSRAHTKHSGSTKEHLIHGGANNSRGRNMIEADASAGGYVHTLARISLSVSIRVSL